MAVKEVTLWNGATKNILTTSFPIVPEKLREELKKRNLTASQVSKELGYGSNSVTAATGAGVMGGSMAKAMEREYRIMRQDYEFTPHCHQEEPEQLQTQEPRGAMITDEALYTTVKNAMMDALNEAISGQMRNFRGMIQAAVQAALKQ